MADKARTAEQVQQPQETKWVWEYDAYTEGSKELSRQKGFKQAQSVESYMGKYTKEKKVRQEIDPFIQYDQPREER